MSRIAIVEHEALIALDIAKTLIRAGYEIAGPSRAARNTLKLRGRALLILF